MMYALAICISLLEYLRSRESSIMSIVGMSMWLFVLVIWVVLSIGPFQIPIP